MSDHETRAYYEAEARLRTRKQPRGQRLELRDDYCSFLADEGRESLIDFGAGPGTDGAPFVAAGLDYLGIDLAVANGPLAAESGLPVVPADLTALPVRSQSFDAGWSMSVLMHLPAARAAIAVREMARVLRPAAPLWLALWGGAGGVHFDETIPGQRRPFHGRPVQANAELLAGAFAIEDIDLWQVGDGEYQVFRLRTHR